MLRIIQNQNQDSAKSYYVSGLSRSDYYTQDQEIIGSWGGRGAKLLRLAGNVDRENFTSLCENRNPENGEQLTPRNNGNRRVGYDFNFNVPKSVSLAFAITQDQEILKSFQSALRQTMEDVEMDMETRVRKSGQNDDRRTSNFIYGEFIHLTSRPVDGVPDPHMHAHCFTFNATFDAEEQTWKAGEFSRIKKNAPYYEALFDVRFSQRLEACGYQVIKTDTSFELKGVEASTLKKFSRRTKEIEDIASQKPNLTSKDKDRLGARTRNHKIKNFSNEELRSTWDSWLTPEERFNLNNLKHDSIPKNRDVTKEAIQYSLNFSLERQSVVSQTSVFTHALKYSLGKGSTNPDQLKSEIHRQIKNQDLIQKNIEKDTFLTTKEVLREEKEMITVFNQTKGKFPPLNSNYECKQDFLSPEQKTAIYHALTCPDGVISIRGGAGVGKTTLLKETVAGIEENAKRVYVFAPTSQASRGVLKEEGFSQATTLQTLLVNKEMQAQVKNQVILVDEAGLLSSKQMNQLLKIAQEQRSRVILSGDTRQHSSVERGDALKILTQQAGLKSIEVNEIRRQTGIYKRIVKDISTGKTDRAFEDLDKLGWIKEIPDSSRNQVIAKDYAQAVSKNQLVLVVSPTHQEGHQVTQAIREELKNQKLLDRQETTFTVQKNLNLTQAQKTDLSSYKEGMIVEINQNLKGFSRGQKLLVIHDTHGQPMLIDSNQVTKPIPTHSSDKIEVYKKETINIAPGDRIQITKNGFDIDKKHWLNNGSIYQVKAVTPEGNIQLNNSWVVSKDYGNLRYGFVTTSYSSQGKTVDQVLIAQSSASFTASDQKQAYVSISRGKTKCTIYTDDKQGLKEVISREKSRMSATELTTKQPEFLIQKLMRNPDREQPIQKVSFDKRPRPLQNNQWDQLLRTRGITTKSTPTPITKSKER